MGYWPTILIGIIILGCDSAAQLLGKRKVDTGAELTAGAFSQGSCERSYALSSQEDYPVSRIAELEGTPCPEENTGIACSVLPNFINSWYVTLGALQGDTVTKHRIDGICADHDLCYRTFGADRGQCDRDFHSQLRSHCMDRYPLAVEFNFQLACLGVAWSSFTAVSDGRDIFLYRQNQALKRMIRCGYEGYSAPDTSYNSKIMADRQSLIQRIIDSLKVDADPVVLDQDPRFQGPGWREKLAAYMFSCIEPEARPYGTKSDDFWDYEKNAD